MNFTTKFLKQTSCRLFERERLNSIGTEKKFDNFKNTLFFTSWKYVFANNIGIWPFKKIDTEYSCASDGVFHVTFDGGLIKLLKFKVSKILHALEIPWPRFTLVNGTHRRRMLRCLTIGYVKIKIVICHLQYFPN